VVVVVAVKVMVVKVVDQVLFLLEDQVQLLFQQLLEDQFQLTQVEIR
jgi:hypothetical protein